MGIKKWLLSRGWRRYMGGTFWYLPRPGYGGMPAMNQELFCQDEARKIELKRSNGYVESPVDRRAGGPPKRFPA